MALTAGASALTARVAVKMVRWRGPSRIGRATTWGMLVTSRAGSNVTARPEATSALRMSPSSLRRRMSGGVAAEAVADVLDDGAEPGAAVARCPRRVLDVGQADRIRPGGARMRWVDRQQRALLQQAPTIDVAMARDRHGLVLDADDEVDRPRAQRLDRRRRLHLHDLDLEVRCGLLQPVQGDREERERRRLHEGHTDAPPRGFPLFWRLPLRSRRWSPGRGWWHHRTLPPARRSPSGGRDRRCSVSSPR
jgi:hypothetical protein